MTLIKSLFLLVNMAVSIRHRRAGRERGSKCKRAYLLLLFQIITHGL